MGREQAQRLNQVERIGGIAQGGQRRGQDDMRPRFQPEQAGKKQRGRHAPDTDPFPGGKIVSHHRSLGPSVQADRIRAQVLVARHDKNIERQAQAQQDPGISGGQKLLEREDRTAHGEFEAEGMKQKMGQ
jgi:hypothetical protein